LAVVLLVAANGFFVAAEFALVTVRRTRVDQLVAEGKGAARVVQREIEHLGNYIAATQLGITLASLALGWVGEPSLSRLLEPLLLPLVGENAHGVVETLIIGGSFLLITVFHIVFGELVPKSMAIQRSEGIALLIARPLDIFARVFRPFIAFINALGTWVLRLMGMQPAGEHMSVHTVEELEMLVTQSREAGVLDNKEEILLRRVFDIGYKSANQVMTPRTEIVGVPHNVTWDELVQTAADQHYTRLPVYQGTLDNISGVIHVKDLFTLLPRFHQNQPFDIHKILRPVLRVPETVLIEDLLTQMQAKKVHLTVLIDEYGGTAGIVTLEDIIEEIVGEVQDEFDTAERDSHEEVEVLPDGSSSVDGMMKIDDFAARFGVTIEETDYETIAGYVFGELGRTPIVGDVVLLDKCQLRVEEMDNLRIARLRVEPISDPPDPDAAVTVIAPADSQAAEAQGAAAVSTPSSRRS
jgi:CBS domain containing-hemolysin-like protein